MDEAKMGWPQYAPAFSGKGREYKICRWPLTALVLVFSCGILSLSCYTWELLWLLTLLLSFVFALFHTLLSPNSHRNKPSILCPFALYSHGLSFLALQSLVL